MNSKVEGSKYKISINLAEPQKTEIKNIEFLNSLKNRDIMRSPRRKSISSQGVNMSLSNSKKCQTVDIKITNHIKEGEDFEKVWDELVSSGLVKVSNEN